MAKAKRIVEETIETGRAIVELPMVEDAGVLAAELRDSGFHVRKMGSSSVDVKAIREQLHLTQEQFALRYGFDLGTLRNWEIGKRKPPTAVASYLRVIERLPDHASEALEDHVA